MMVYDESKLLSQLRKLDRVHRAAFAAVCAERLFPLYDRFSAITKRGDPKTLRNALDCLWYAIRSKEVVPDIRLLKALADKCEALTPAEDTDWNELTAYAQNTTASVSYSLRCSVTGEAEFALWSARSAYEAVDYFVHNTHSIDFASASAEAQVLNSPIVQQELGRQCVDLADLSEPATGDWEAIVEKIRIRATKVQLIPI